MCTSVHGEVVSFPDPLPAAILFCREKWVWYLFARYYPPIAGVQSDCLHGNINEYVTCCHLNLDTFNVTKRCRSYHGYSFAETLVGTFFFFETPRRNCSGPGVRKS